MKTVVIWDDCEANLKFVVVDGDKRHLDGIYINSNDDEKLQDEVNLLFCDEKGNQLRKLVDEFPYEEVKNGAFVIRAGFLP